MSKTYGSGKKIAPGNAPSGISNSTIVANVGSGSVPNNPMYVLKTSKSITEPSNKFAKPQIVKKIESLSESEIEKNVNY